MKKLYLLFLSIGFFNSYGQGCVNGGFESGLTNDYTFKQYVTAPKTVYQSCNTITTNNSNFVTFDPNTTGTNNMAAAASLVTTTPGFESEQNNYYNVPMQLVHSGNNAVRLFANINHDIITMTRTVTGSSAINFSFLLTLRYNPTHDNGFPIDRTEQSFFRVRLLNGSTVVQTLCIQANPDVCYFNKLSNGENADLVLYTDWVCAGFDASAYEGLPLTLEFTVAGCLSNSKHYAKVYIDDICGSCSDSDYFENCCKANATVTNTVSPNQIRNYERSQWIAAENLVSTTATAIYHAGESVTLNPGFEAANGAIFSAYAQGCTPPGNFVYRQTDPDDEETKQTKTLKIIPNPSSHMIEIQSEKSFSEITILSVDGKVMFRKKSGEGTQFAVDISNFSNGLYLVNVTTDTGEILTAKLLKN